MALPVSVSRKRLSWYGVGRSAVVALELFLRLPATGKEARFSAAKTRRRATVLDHEAMMAEVVELMCT